MFTPARICYAIGMTATGVLAMADAQGMPSWAKIVIGAIGLFAGTVVAAGGPIQNSSSDNALAKIVVAQSKGGQ